MSIRSQSLALSQAPAQSIAYSAAPAQSIALSQAPAQSIALSAPAQSIAYSAAPAQSIAVSIAAEPIAVAADPSAAQALQRWADYSPENVDLADPILPEPSFKCYAPPQVPPGQTRFLQVDEGAQLKNVSQNFNDVRTAVRENNTHLQRNRTQITQVNRNHNHLLRIVTNENNFEHNLTNKIVRVQDTHRQQIQNVKGETRNFKDFKQTQKVENLGCQRDATVAVAAPAPQQACAAPAISVAASRPATVISRPATAVSVAASRPATAFTISPAARTLAPSITTQVQYL